MQQLELFDYRKDYIFDKENQIAHYYDILSETRDTISYSEHIDPKKVSLYAEWIMRNMLMLRKYN